MDFYSKVPKDRAGNLKYRAKIRKWADESPRNRAAVLKMCQTDILYWMNTFVWVFEPRTRLHHGNPDMPFITWPHQDPCITQLHEHLGLRDIGVEKSRGEGISWSVVLVLLHSFIFSKHPQAFGLVSRNKEAASDPTDPDSLFWKILYELKWQPSWMINDDEWEYNKSKSTIVNTKTASSFAAYAATGEVARGGRKTAFFMDELASWRPPDTPAGADEEAMKSVQSVTDCRIFVSTPKGTDGVYYRMMHEKSNICKIRLEWRQNPTRNRGLYKVTDGFPLPIDVEKYGDLPPDYKDPTKWKQIRSDIGDRGYDIMADTRSPWYDNECLRAGANSVLISQELDMNYGGSVSKFFPIQLVEKCIRRDAQPPARNGYLQYRGEDETPTWIDDHAGHMKLWCKLSDLTNRPPTGKYIAGCDIATGGGGEQSSNSVMSILDVTTGIKVAEFAHPRIYPHDFAHLAVSACHWFSSSDGVPAQLIWENGGPGVQFRREILNGTFRNIYYASTEGDIANKKTRRPGWNTSTRSKPELFGQYLVALQKGEFINRSKDALDECKQYVRLADGQKIEHVGSLAPDDPSGAGAAHGDRVIADALANWCRMERKPKTTRRSPSIAAVKAYATGTETGNMAVPPSSPMARRLEHLAEGKKKNYRGWKSSKG